MALADVRIRAAKPAAKAYRLVDTGGLHLFVTPQGGKLWRLRYKVAGREKVLSFGPYPEVTLAATRDARDTAREELRGGQDPALAKRHRRATAAANAANTFEAIAREWLAPIEWSRRNVREAWPMVALSLLDLFEAAALAASAWPPPARAGDSPARCAGVLCCSAGATARSAPGPRGAS